MNWSEIALAIVSALTAAIGGWWAFLGKKQQTAATQQTSFYEQLLTEVQSLRNQNLELQKQILTLQDEVRDLRNKLEQYEENPALSHARSLMENIFNAGFSNPAWLHDVASNRWYLNDSYCTRFSIKRLGFWTPVNLLGRYDKEDALKYVRNDLDVIQTGVSITFTERVRVRIMDPRCDEYFEALFRKTPIIVEDHPYVLGEMLEESDKDRNGVLDD